MDEPLIMAPDLDEIEKYITQLVTNAGADGITEDDAFEAMQALQSLIVAATLVELLEEGAATIGWDRDARALRFFAVERVPDE